jgi:hypothetical protein
MASNIVRVKLQGTDLGTFDFEKFNVSDGILIKSKTGLTVKQFFDGIGEMDAEALQAFVWLLQRRQGSQVPDPRAIDFPIAALDVSDEPDPPPAAGAATLPVSAPVTDPAQSTTSGTDAATTSAY